jgi:hypothetical protein
LTSANPAAAEATVPAPEYWSSWWVDTLSPGTMSPKPIVLNELEKNIY